MSDNNDTLPNPQSRLDSYLVGAINKSSEGLPNPLSREEVYLKKLIEVLENGGSDTGVKDVKVNGQSVVDGNKIANVTTIEPIKFDAFSELVNLMLTQEERESRTSNYSIKQMFLIKQTGVPDLWVSSINDTYADNDNIPYILQQFDSDGHADIGWYTFSIFEAPYVPIDTLSEIEAKFESLEQNIEYLGSLKHISSVVVGSDAIDIFIE